MRYSFEQLKGYLRAAGFPESVINIMAAIGLSESGGDASSYRYCDGGGWCTVRQGGRTRREREVRGQSAETSAGIWQINLNAHPEYRNANLSDPLVNARAAYDIFFNKKQGFRAWGSYTDGNYKKYLGGGSIAQPNFTGISNNVGAVNASFSFDDFLGVEVVGAKNRYLVAFAILVIIFIFAFN